MTSCALEATSKITESPDRIGLFPILSNEEFQSNWFLFLFFFQCCKVSTYNIASWLGTQRNNMEAKNNGVVKGQNKLLKQNNNCVRERNFCYLEYMVFWRNGQPLPGLNTFNFYNNVLIDPWEPLRETFKKFLLFVEAVKAKFLGGQLNNGHRDTGQLLKIAQILPHMPCKM